MDNQQWTEVQPFAPNSQPEQLPNSLATASMVFGILAVVTFCCFYSVFLFGGLGLILGLMSKKPKEPMNKKAKIGIGLSILGFVLTLFVVIAFILYVAAIPMEAYEFKNMPLFPVPLDETEGLKNILTIGWNFFLWG